MQEKASKKHTTVHDRFHIGSPRLGLIATAKSRSGAFSIADRGSDDVTVFDSMARIGCAQVWEKAWGWRVKERRRASVND